MPSANGIPAELAAEFASAVGNDRIGTVLVSETPTTRVWHMRLAPGERIPAHRHDRPYFWTILTDGKGRSRYGNGTLAEVSYQAGDTRHFPDLTPETSFVHDLTNTGDTDLVFVTVEYSGKV